VKEVPAMISTEAFMDILAFHRQGHSERWIAKKLGIHRNTVKKYITYKKLPKYCKKKRRESILSPYHHIIRDAQIFVAALGASSYTYAEATWIQSFSDWIVSHVRCFEFFGGVSEAVVPNNLKTGVTKANYYEPDINPTYPACALAQKDCRQGLTARYWRLPRLLQELTIAKGDGRYEKLLKGFARTDLLVIDDEGLSKLVKEQRHDLLEIFEDRHGLRSTLIAGQLPVEH
jgi:hypothetical protein